MGFGSVSIWEILLIFVVAIIVLGPRRLPEMARKFGRFLRSVRMMGSEITTAVSRELDETKEDLTPADSEANKAEEAEPLEIHPKTGLPIPAQPEAATAKKAAKKGVKPQPAKSKAATRPVKATKAKPRPAKSKAAAPDKAKSGASPAAPPKDNPPENQGKASAKK
jgi:sec-independent protein translocase protein TatB